MNSDNLDDIFQDPESAFKAIHAFMENVDPRLVDVNVSNSIFKLAPLLTNYNKSRITKTKINQAKLSLEDAKVDINSSRLLLDGNIYSRSVFCLQQSVEKACKALGLVLGFIDKQKAIKHDSPAVFIKMLEDQFSIEYLLPLLKQYTNEDQQANIENAKNTIFKRKSRLFKLTEAELQSYILFIESMEGQGADKLRTEFKNIQGSLDIFLPQIEIKIESIVDFVLCNMKLYILSVITFPHTMTSRYSDQSIMNPKHYTKEMPLVKYLPQFQDITESAIESLDIYIKNIETQ